MSTFSSPPSDYIFNLVPNTIPRSLCGGDWLDRIGAFWLIGCAFGPFFGWIVTTGTIPITPNSWRWLYGLRVFLAAGIPVVLALPLTRYLRGQAGWVALPLLLGVTLLPVSSAMNVSRDLWEGPIVQQAEAGGDRSCT